MLLITSGEYYAGQSLALQLLQQPEFQGKVRVSCRDTSRCENLRKLGAELVQIDHQNQQQLEKIVHGIQYIVLAVDPEDDCVSSTENIVRAAAQAQVKNVIILSQNGVEGSQQKRLRELLEIEQRCQKHLGNSNWVILRTDFFQQNFLLWVNSVQEKHQFPLPISQQNKFTPVDINDAVRVIRTLIVQGKNEFQPELDAQHNRRVYTLTGPEAVDGNRIVEELKRGTGIDDCKFHEWKRQELERYLKDLNANQRHQDKLRQQDGQLVLPKINQQRLKHKVPGNLTDVQIEIYLDTFDWIKSGQADRVSKDLERIAGQEGQRLGQFFKDHANEFNPRP